MNTETPRAGKLSGFRDLLGYHVVDWREGHAEISLDLDQRHMNGMGIVHGGLYATVLDAACGHAATWCRIKGNTRGCVTVSLTTHFLHPATEGRLLARGTLECVHDRIAVCRAEIVDEAGMLLAIGQGSFRYAAGSERLEGVPRGANRLPPVRGTR
jgi:uncharacterized protein (TIGR00369 family)